MKRLTLLLALVLAPSTQALDIAVEDLGGGSFTISWESTPSNPGDATPIYYAFQLQETVDLLTDWTPVGTNIPTRIGGTSQTESITLNAPTNRYYRLAYQVDLSGQDLSGMDFSNMTLSGAILENTDFSGADLTGAELLNTSLEGTDFTGAMLDGARFDSDAVGAYQLTEFGGAETSLVAALPSLPTFAFTADFVTTIVGFEGIATSEKTLVVQANASATLGELNALLSNVGARVAGTVGPAVGMSAPLVALRFDGASGVDICQIKTNLLANPIIDQAVLDIALNERVQPSYVGRTDFPDAWEWDDPGDSNLNWGLEYTRVPAMWNFNDAIEKLRVERNHDPAMDPPVFVLDRGYQYKHPELAENVTRFRSPLVLDHGTFVTAIVGAEFTDHRSPSGYGGMEGVDPFSNLFFKGFLETFSFLTQLKDIVWLQVNQEARVINCSFGHNWVERDTNGTFVAISPASRPAVLSEMTEWAGYSQLTLEAMSMYSQVPFIVIAAGNDSVDTQWAGGLERYARTIGSSDILTVGSQDILSDNVYTGSNSNVDMLAPGREVGGIIARRITTNTYFSSTGTSYAAPHVTGLASYLLHLNPQLSNHDLKRLVTLDNIVPPGSGGTPTRMNAFQSVLLLDTVAPVPEKSAKLMLLDVDDGTPDGNLRLRYNPPANFFPLNPPTTQLYTKEWTTDAGDPGADLQPGATTNLFLPGDGVLDMSDFRKWRDYVQYALDGGLPSLMLDGGTNHIKRDANHNGVVEAPSNETFYARTDFNGDGVLTAFVPDPETGKTDLDILTESGLWSDPYVPVTDLPGLVDSGDLRIVAVEDVLIEFVPVFDRVVINVSGGGWNRTRDISFPVFNNAIFWNYHVQDFIVTLPVGTHTVHVTFEDTGSGNTVSFERTIPIGLCEDAFFAVDATDLVF